MVRTSRPRKAALGLLAILFALGLLEGLTWIVALAGSWDWRVDPLPLPRQSKLICNDGPRLKLCPDKGDQYERVRPVSFSSLPLKPRIVVIGESFAFGMRLPLAQAWPARVEHHLGGRAEVLNFGRCGSYTGRLKPVFEASLKLRPSVVVLALGNNEHTMTTFFVGWAGRHPLAVYQTLETLGGSQLFGALYRLVGGAPHAEEDFDARPRRFVSQVEQRIFAARRRPPDLSVFSLGLAGEEVTAALRSEKSLKERIFLGHVRSMLEQGKRADVRIVLTTLPVDLRVPPTLSGTSGPDVDRLRSLLKELKHARLPRSLQLIRQGLSMDSRVALLHFEEGRLLLDKGQRKAAAVAFRRSTEWDLIPDSTPTINNILRSLAREHSVPLVDLDRLSERSLGGSKRIFNDRVHLNAEGCDLVGKILSRAIAPLLPK